MYKNLKQTYAKEIKVPFTELSSIRTCRGEQELNRIKNAKPKINLTYNEKQKVKQFLARCETIKDLG